MGKCGREALSADVMAEGHQWWPVIWVEVEGVLTPVYCPGLAWAGSRPWEAHSSRMAEVGRPRVVMDELGPEWQIVGVADEAHGGMYS